MKYIIILILSICLYACNDDDNSKVSIDTGIGIKVFNANGDDLLNSNSTNHFNDNDIRLYKLENGERTLIYNQNADLPYGFKIVMGNDGINILDAGFLPNSEDTYPQYIVKWSDTEQDTLKCEVEQLANVLRFSKVWVNDELQWESNSQTERIVTVVID